MNRYILVLFLLNPRCSLMSQATSVHEGDGYPTVLSTAPVDDGKADRAARNTRFEYSANLAPIGDPGGDRVLFHSSNPYRRFPPVPKNADMIVEAEVISSSAHFSAHKSDVYSEYLLKPTRFFRGVTQAPAGEPADLTAIREGGNVTFPTGSRVFVRVAGELSPVAGRTYIFFLMRNEKGRDYRIITGYEISGAIVHPLDSDGDKYIPYDGMSFTEFIAGLN